MKRFSGHIRKYYSIMLPEVGFFLFVLFSALKTNEHHQKNVTIFGGVLELGHNSRTGV